MIENNISTVHDVLANVIMFIFKHDTISTADIVGRFKLSLEATTNIINTMVAANIINEANEAGLHQLRVKCLDDINEGIVEFLNEQGFSKEQIVDAFKTPTTAEKDEVSIILNEKRNWVNISETKPEVNVPVAIRMVNKGMIYTENRSEVLYAEDIKIAEWDGNNWTIIPPYPKYDYSPLSKYGTLNEGTVVTHWGEILSEELLAWKTRFDRLHGYNLKIEVDPDWEEDVYRALMWGAAYISKFGGPDFNNEDGKGLRKMYEVLCDMQACIDNNHPQENTIPEIVMNLADYIVSSASGESTNGIYDVTFSELVNQTSKEYINEHLHELVYELLSRDEIVDVDVDYIDRILLCSIDPHYCVNYEWQEGDEEIFECTKEEWEKMKPFPIILKRGNE